MATSRTKAPTARAKVPFKQLRALFGKPVDDRAVKAVLARAGKTFVPKIARGRLIVAGDAGFDLSLSPRDGKRGAPLIIDLLVLYGDGIATPDTPVRSRSELVHQQYGDPPHPFGFDRRVEILARAPKPRETWLWGKGAVAVSAPLVSYDEWIVDGLELQVHYTEGPRNPASSATAFAQHITIVEAR